MDNKQDRQFYWEVKDFMNKNPEIATPSNQKSKVVDSVKQILEQNKLYKQSAFDAKSSAVNNVNSQLSAISKSENGYANNSPAYSKNNISNPFQLNERREAVGFGGDAGSQRQTWAQRNPEAYARNRAEAQAAQERRASNLAASNRRRREDEAAEFNQGQGDALQGPTPTGGNVSNQLEMDPDNPTLPLDNPANRTKLQDFRQTKQAKYMAGKMEELAAKDPSSLTSSEAAELSLFKSMTSGKVASAGLSGKIQSQLEKGVAGSARTVPMVGPGGMVIPAPNLSSPTQTAQNIMARTIGRSQEDLVGQSQRMGKQEAEAKAAEQADYDAKLAAERYQKMQGTRIQGTNMTYGQFKQQYGRDYDALNSEDSSMLVRAASNRSAFRVSPEARALDQTVVDFNRASRERTAQDAQKQGEIDRRVDQAQREYDQSFRTVVDPTRGGSVPWTAKVPESFIKEWERQQQQSGKVPARPRPGQEGVEYPGLAAAWEEEQKRRGAEKEKWRSLPVPSGQVGDDAQTLRDAGRISVRNNRGMTPSQSVSQKISAMNRSIGPKTYRL